MHVKEKIVCNHEPKYAKGMCRNCYEKDKYNNDAKLRKRKIAGAIKYRNEMKKKPGWNASRQKKFRDKNPISFNKTMSRCYLRKLPTTEIVNVYNEIMKERELKKK
jgi:hypothetical protein